jgi:hypothetical protein
MTCVILQDDSESAEDQSHVAKLPSRSGEDLSRHESESTKDLSTQVLQRQWTRKSHYVPPPLILTNSEFPPSFIVDPGTNHYDVDTTLDKHNLWLSMKCVS